MSACDLRRVTVITSRIDRTKRSWTTSRRLSLPDSAVQLALQHDERCLNAAFLASDRSSTKGCAGDMAAAVRFWPTREGLFAVCDQTSLDRTTRRKDWISGANGAALR
jgi:hypothetical protein